VINTVDFYNPLIDCFPNTLLRYFLNDFKIVPVTTVVTGIIFVSILHIGCLLLLLFLCYRKHSLPFHLTSAPGTDILLKDDSCSAGSMLLTEFGPNRANKICCPFCEYYALTMILHIVSTKSPLTQQIFACISGSSISPRKVWMIPTFHDIKNSAHLNLRDNNCISYFSTLNSSTYTNRKVKVVHLPTMKACIFNFGTRWTCGFNIMLRPLYPGEGALVPFVKLTG